MFRTGYFLLPHIGSYIYTVVFILFCISPTKTSKLKEIMIRNIYQIFDGDSSNNFIITSNNQGNTTLTSNNGEGQNQNQNQNPWTNEGFICTNATQITSSEGNTATTTKILLATKASSLSTQIKDFSHTFLVIKFSSIIGHSEPQPPSEPPTTPTPPTTTTTIIPQPQLVEEIMYATTEFFSDVETSPKVIVLGNINGNNDEDKAINEKSRYVVDGPSSSINYQKPSLSIIPPEYKIIPLPPPPPTILKLNADGSDGNQVLEIAIDPSVLSQSNSSPPQGLLSFNSKKSKRSGGEGETINSGEEKIINIEPLPKAEPLILPSVDDFNNTDNNNNNRLPELDSEPETDPTSIDIDTIDKRRRRRKRDFDSNKDIKNIPNNKKKLPYHTWKASMDKSFRPPGFYVAVDDKVVFDNWIGVWQSHQSPTVMGRHGTPKKNGIWNDTMLMLQFDEIPDRSIKISFEWEPSEPNAYLFLSNISISTFGSNETNIENNRVLGPSYGDSKNGERNITLYIVLKTPSQGTTDQVIKMGGDQQEVVVQNSPEQKVVTNPTTTTTYPPPVNPSTTLHTNKPTEAVVLKSSTPSQNPAKSSNTGLIVACVTGALFTVILIFLIRKKLQVNKSPNHYHNSYIDEL